MSGEDRDEVGHPPSKSLDMLAREALALHDGDLVGAGRMVSYIITRRTYLLDALVADYLARIQENDGVA
jgi:hypothetical protein